VRVMRGHYSRVSSLSFNSVLFSGSKDTTILGHDIKSPNNVMARFDGHKAEVCGLKHDASGLASGSNDNTAVIWDINAGKERFTLNGHKAAVKALAWCPWQRGLLATGGGTTDKTMKFWNTDTGKLINSVNTESQVCSLIWNRAEKEIMSSHGFSHNQLCIWKVISYIM
jgi:cell division cycle protein 20 (cofactor of APC complex)